MLNALTIDVEDFFHAEPVSRVVPREMWETMPSRVEQNMERVFDILARHNVRATMFFVGWIAERHSHLVELAHQLGHEIGCHSYWHRPVNWLTPDQFREDTYRARSIIEDAASAPVYGYRAPFYSITQDVDWAFEVLSDLGFTYDSSLYPVGRQAYVDEVDLRFAHKVAFGTLLEVPVTTMRIGRTNLPLGTGTCLRTMPYWYVASEIRKMNEQDKLPATISLQPCDVDTRQPRLPLAMGAKVRQYHGLDSMGKKLEMLLKDFEMAPLSQVFEAHFSTLNSLVV
jgi:polysaccharide deacetylase family protein (PEP-CTERM system associated)